MDSKSKERYMKQWQKLKATPDDGERMIFKELQQKINGMFMGEYDSDFVNSGDEDTKRELSKMSVRLPNYNVPKQQLKYSIDKLKGKIREVSNDSYI